MRVFALSDIHVDYETNKQWIANLSAFDYRDDILILAGDITDSLPLLEWSLKVVESRFKKVLFTPGNHELWVVRDRSTRTSFDKFKDVCKVAADCNVSMQACRFGAISIVPLLSWYDYSFGMPGRDLLLGWMDYRACRWPDGYGMEEITAHFLQINEETINTCSNATISFSHFLPRIDIMPNYIPISSRSLYPILGTRKLEAQIRRLQSKIHVYGHSHVNRAVTIDGIAYINNAFGYPRETRITAKRLACIYETK